MVMEIILNNPTLSGLVIFISQILFIGLRTVNVIYTSDRKVWATIITGLGISVFWLISISLGINSVLKGDIFPIMMFIIGGAVGTFIGFKVEEKVKLWKKK